MPKIRTHKGAAKRFRLTKNGKVLRAHGGKSHMLEKKSQKRKRLFGALEPVSKGLAKVVKVAAPYLGKG
ncbi:MAG: 50S ribosomal protein L35 [Candidatus Dormibacteria bacterium]